MAHRVELQTKGDSRGKALQDKLRKLGFNLKQVDVVDVYTISGDDVEVSLERLKHPVLQKEYTPKDFDWAIEIGYLPGVTDSVGLTAKEMLGNDVHSSQMILFRSGLSEEQIKEIAGHLHNPLVQNAKVISALEYARGLEAKISKVGVESEIRIDHVNLYGPDEELEVLGKEGILNEDGTRRGPLAMSLEYLHAVREGLNRNPTDCELEVIAQHWSEHCNHNIFANPIDDITEGLFKHYIKGATEKVRELRGDDDICVSVFDDNGGIIKGKGDTLLVVKCETHNTPSSLDPRGGAGTGLLGDFRDITSTGLGAKPIIGGYLYCVGRPDDERVLCRKEGKDPMLLPRMHLEGIVDGVQEAGNCMGVPTVNGKIVVHDDYRGKPLVYVSSLGVIPKKIAGKDSWKKKAQPGDLIVSIGGRVGKDGIHGATFSSEELDEGSPSTAVQIHEPITQKRYMDAMLEARDLGLYSSTTDCGAGGLSCAVFEMARESGGCELFLEKVPTKYPGLQPWEILISESQERQVFAVPPEKQYEFEQVMRKHGVESTVLGMFNDWGTVEATYNGELAVNLDLDFLQNGMPKIQQNTSYEKVAFKEPVIEFESDLSKQFEKMLTRYNIAGYSFITEQKDHEVQGGSVLKPLQGAGRVNADAAVVRPKIDEEWGVAVSQGICPTYSQINPYSMAMNAVDMAVKNVVCAGAKLNHIALMDNFCWSSSDDPVRLGQLKEACEGLYDAVVEYLVPLVSGKDSMYNDFKGYDEEGNEIKVSVPPTLLISSTGLVDDIRKCVSLDAKISGDFVYVIGETHEELGGSEYFAMRGEEIGEKYIGNNVPKVDLAQNLKLYEALETAIDSGLVASAQGVGIGGLAVALSKTAMGGKKGMNLDIRNLPGTVSRDDYALFSESAGRVVVTVAPEVSKEFEEIMGENAYANIGSVSEEGNFKIQGRDGLVVDSHVCQMLQIYRGTFEQW